MGWGNESLGHMIKIFPMPIYVKNLLKTFFSGLERLKTLKLGMQN